MQQPLSDDEESSQSQSGSEQNSEAEAFNVEDEERGIGYRIDRGGNRISAHSLDDPDNEVGHVQIADEFLDQVNVNEDFHRRGIGTRLIELAIEELGLSYIACVQENDAYTFSLTPPGERLVASCIRAGIVKANMCIFSNDPENRILDEEASGDPGYDSIIVSGALGRNARRHQDDDREDEDEEEEVESAGPDDFYYEDNDPEIERRKIAESDEVDPDEPELLPDKPDSDLEILLEIGRRRKAPVPSGLVLYDQSTESPPPAKPNSPKGSP